MEALRLRRGRTTVVSAFSWHAGPGAIAWVVGENGSGKSTLLRALAGRLRPTAGRIRLLPGHGPAGGRTRYYHPAMALPAEAPLGAFRGLTGRLQPARRPGVDALPDLDTIQVSPGRALGTLSTGESRRVLLAALLARPADLVLLDEPFEHLSASARAALTDALVRAARRAIVVIATNQPPTARGTVLELRPGLPPATRSIG